MNLRRKSKKIFIGNIPVGGDSPISVQSMTNTKTQNIEKTVTQIKELTAAGCEIIRVAVPDKESADKLAMIKKNIEIPLVADIHFNYKLALEAIAQDVDGLRINPGNIGKEEYVYKIIKEAKKSQIPIRVGVNSGSIEKRLLEKYGRPTAEAMVESALSHVKLLEKYDFYDIIISLKSTDIWMTLKAHDIISKKVDYPFHIGITEAGGGTSGTVKSAAGAGALLTSGYGDTIRISLTGNPVKEVEVAWEILKSLNLRKRGPEIISCPTCGRTRINLTEVAEKVKARLTDINKPVKIAVMGCEVNGPGEAREADIGIAGGKNKGYIFKKGKLIKKVPENQLVESLIKEIKMM
ncbi:MAG: flavodoxin-dependent (E)-4-hydroxy-3-methylbut-2-enyl-diphosphate synthase [Bacillota bacterium]